MTEQNVTESQNTNTNTNTKKKKIIICCACGLLLTAAIYVLIGLSWQKKFLPGTAVNGMDLSGMTPAQAETYINETVNQYILTLEEPDGNSEQIDGNSIELRADYRDSLNGLLTGQNILFWGPYLFQGKNYSVDAEITFNEEKLSSVIDGLSCMDKSRWKPSENARFEYAEKEGYRIVPEVQGTEIQSDQLFTAVSEAICRLDKTLSLTDAQVYRQPAVTSDDPELQKQSALFEPYTDMTVTYHFGSETEILDVGLFHDWLSVDGNGDLTVDREAVNDYVKELGKKYNTAYSSKTFQTSYGPEITIKGGFYGWMIDREQETEALTQILLSGKSEDREPIYSLEAASHDTPDYGNSYVEINLTAQHLFLYKDGELILESDLVSGDSSKGKDTPGGAYAINYKERNAILSGEDYRTTVSYWMPFNGNIGMHDCAWRPAFGGVIYQTNGSRGCINLPVSVAKKLYENTEPGFPVLCYYLSGTGETPEAAPLPEGAETTPEAVPSEPIITAPENAPVPEAPPAEEIPAGETPEAESAEP